MAERLPQYPWHVIPGSSFLNRGFALRSASDDEVFDIQQRDFGSIYSYLLAPHWDPVAQTVLSFEGTPLGFSVAGMLQGDEDGNFDRSGMIRYGEVGFVHTSPKVRGMGLGTLLGHLATLHVLTASPDRLYAAVGDKTGTVEKTVRQLGFRLVDDGAIPTFIRVIADERDKRLLELAVTKKVMRSTAMIAEQIPLIRAAAEEIS